MKGQFFLLVASLAIANVHAAYGYFDDNKENPYRDRNYNNPIYAEFKEPNATVQADLHKLRFLKVLDFYTALDELYLTGGFDKSGTINSIILSQKEISKTVYGLLIRSLTGTRRELKYGDASLTVLNAEIDGTEDKQTRELLEAVKKAIREATGTKDEETFVERISKIQLESMEDLKNLNSGSGANAELLSSLLEELGTKISKKSLGIMSKAIQNAFYTGIGGTDAIRDTVIAGARLLYNFGGSVGSVSTKCQEFADAVSQDPKFKNKIDGALEIVKRINRTDGEFGYKLVFENFFDEQPPTGNMIFLPSKLIKLETLLPLFKTLMKTDEEILKKMIKAISLDRSRIRQFQWFVDKIQNETAASALMTERFEVEINDEQVPVYRAIVEDITALSVDSAYLMRYLKSIRDMLETGNFKKFVSNLIRFSQLSRDSKWRDDWMAIKEATDIALSPQITVFKGWNETVTGSYEEVLLAMRMMLDGGMVEEKCKLIEEFYGGMEDREQVLEVLGIQVADMHEWIDSTEYIDALVDVLKSSESFSNLNRLLEFHAKYTTVDKKPLESMQLIDAFIRYLESSGRWNKKSSRRSGS
ncbi:hypothetical protein CAEBREN_28170 [Caenorhabditis brenneri]|uniref:Uncharacterized protein n=1 Tax=Caenorhabditis brenneri TaxID=135651 RepID=G0N2R8_CAEBE|nr:hypothetical protein CAEBREN_28170 [Caenorhabditis brenneri]